MNKKNKTKLKEIPVVFSCDDRYVPYLSVTIKSLIDNASKVCFYSLFVFHNGIKPINQKKIKSLATENVDIQFVNVKRRLAHMTKSLHLRDYYSESIYFRLFIPSVFAEYEKVIYLDSDMVVLDDIAKLYHVELGDNLVAAVSDAVVPLDKDLINYVVNYVGVDKPQDYFNSGMLLMNVKEFRNARIEQRFIELFNDYNFSTVAPDQDYLNALCKNRVLYLDSSWNKMMMDMSESNELHIIHYNMFYKPWLYKGVRFEKYFWKYAVRTPFYFDLKKTRSDYTEEKKIEDKQSSALMVEAALHYLEDSNSFRNVICMKEAY